WDATRTAIGIEPLGSFEDWSFRIRQPLLWLDYNDPCDSIETVRENDPRRDALLTVLLEWRQAIGVQKSHTTQQVESRAVVDAAFFSALMAVAANPTGTTISSIRLGRWLHQVQGKIVNKLKLVKDKSTSGYPYWTLLEV